MKELNETVAYMNSDNYEHRFRAEYHQTKTRYERLHKIVVKAEAGTLDFKLSCDIDLLKKQKMFMGNYLYCLEVRAEIEGVDLEF